MNYSRRDMIKLGLGALPVAQLLSFGPALSAAEPVAAGKPNSNFNGVQIGIIAPYAFRGSVNSAEDILKSLVDLGLSGVELQNNPVEAYAGAPMPAGRGGPGAGGPPPAAAGAGGGAGPGGLGGAGGAGRGGGRGGPGGPSPELKAWRLAAPMDRIAAFRKMYEDAGVNIYGFKLALTETMSDAEFDYAFNVTKAIGPNAHLTMELPTSAALTARIGQFATKHKVMVGYHNHTQVNETSWDEAMAQSEYNGINLDVGHFTAAISKSALPFIQKHHRRITSMHFKDRAYNEGANLPWGWGQTPLREVLLLMKNEKYTFPATIELEYGIPAYSTVMNELRRCVDFCRNVLV